MFNHKFSYFCCPISDIVSFVIYEILYFIIFCIILHPFLNNPPFYTMCPKELILPFTECDRRSLFWLLQDVIEGDYSPIFKMWHKEFILQNVTEGVNTPWCIMWDKERMVSFTECDTTNLCSFLQDMTEGVYSPFYRIWQKELMPRFPECDMGRLCFALQLQTQYLEFSVRWTTFRYRPKFQGTWK